MNVEIRNVSPMNEFMVWKMKSVESGLLRGVHAVVILMLFVVAGCSPATSSPGEIEAGSSKGEVIALLGDPDQTQEFILPDEPFFGPQESLVNLVPAGTAIEEWIYELGEDVLYIWFTSEGDDSGEEWLVLDTARHPKDAVY